jgi:hypothetical protein
VQKLHVLDLIFVFLRLLYNPLSTSLQVFLHVDLLYWFHINRPYLTVGKKGGATRLTKCHIKIILWVTLQGKKVFP